MLEDVLGGMLEGMLGGMLEGMLEEMLEEMLEGMFEGMLEGMHSSAEQLSCTGCRRQDEEAVDDDCCLVGSGVTEQ